MTITRARAISEQPANGTTGSVQLDGGPGESSLLVAVVTCMAEGATRSTTDVSDSFYGAWTKVPDAATFEFSGWIGEVSIWYYLTTTPATTVPYVTASFGGNVATNCMSIVEYVGIPMQIALDASAAQDSDDGTSHTTTDTATTQTDLLIGGFGDWGTESVYSAGSGWTKVTAFENSSHIQCMLQDKGVGSTGVAADTYAASCTTDIDTTVGAVFAAFQVSTGPPVAGQPLYRLVESSGAYSERPVDAQYVDFYGSVDPGELLQLGDSWTRTRSSPS